MPHTPIDPPTPAALNELHWRAAAEEGLRLAAKRWRVPLENITEIALVDTDGPCYVFKALYTDAHGQRFTAALHMPKCMNYTSPLAMSMLSPGLTPAAGQDGPSSDDSAATNPQPWSGWAGLH